MKLNWNSKHKKFILAALCISVLCAYGIILRGETASAAEQTASDNTWSESAEATEPELNMAKVTLDTTSITGYLVPSYTYGSAVYYANAEADITVNSPTVLDEKNGIRLSCKSSNKNVSASASLSDNILHLRLYADKKCSTKLTVTIEGKKFQIKASLKPVKLSASSLLLVKGKTKKLKISGCSKGIQWSSSNKKIATISQKGVVKGKKVGNTIITAKINGKPIGCAVSVTTSQLKKVCERATYIGNHWTYSQAKRTQPGYYDCSSLVWKAYKECAGFTFGNASYPGTSASESAWCRANNRMIKGGYTNKKLQKMQLNPGDLIFKSSDLRNPYNTTYHVEMFTGYTCLGYDSQGKPVIAALWASRNSGYSVANGSLLARPLR
ncbi:MAG: C40 family peptidase [Lachnospiraceae bacterium]|nr:C40 family peptidase [Lachnospiraceae bacterium]